MGGFVHQPEFRAGLLAGVIATIGVIVLYAVWRGSGRRGSLPWVGIAFSLATVTALDSRVDLANGVVPGVMLLALAGWLTFGLPLPIPVRLVAALPGACLLAFDGGLPAITWIQVLVVGMTILGAWSVADFDGRWASRGYVPVLWAVSVVGVYYTVPDTTEALVLLGAALPLLLVGWPWPLGSFGTAGSWAAMGLFTWTVAIEGYYRPSAIVGGMACIGILTLEPVVRMLRQDRWTPLELLSPSRWGILPLAAGHLGLVYLASRVAGLQGHNGPKHNLMGGLLPSLLIVGVEVIGVLGLGLVLRCRQKSALTG